MIVFFRCSFFEHFQLGISIRVLSGLCSLSIFFLLFYSTSSAYPLHSAEQCKRFHMNISKVPERRLEKKHGRRWYGNIIVALVAEISSPQVQIFTAQLFLDYESEDFIQLVYPVFLLKVDGS